MKIMNIKLHIKNEKVHENRKKHIYIHTKYKTTTTTTTATTLLSSHCTKKHVCS